MKTPYEAAITRMYPHLVTRGPRHPTFGSIAVSNVPLGRKPCGRHAYVGVGMLDADGNLTPRGRSVIAAAIAAEASSEKADICVVWGERDCTWYDRDGTGRDGMDPPQATDTFNTYMYDRLPVTTEDCWTFALPVEASVSHLCVLKVDRTRIEIAPGEPIMLAWFDEPVVEGERDPAHDLIGPDGDITPPARYRGQPVTGMEDGTTLLGPIQPSEEGTIIRTPWPQQIRDACRSIAGLDVDESIIERIFDIAHAGAEDMNHVGILKAA